MGNSERSIRTGVIYLAEIKGQKYIGKSINFSTRKKVHLKAEEPSIFHDAIREHGSDSIKWTILESDILEKDLVDREVYWINYYDTCLNGLNTKVRGYKISGKSKSERKPKKPRKETQRKRKIQCQEAIRLSFEKEIPEGQACKIIGIPQSYLSQYKKTKDYDTFSRKLMDAAMEKFRERLESGEFDKTKEKEVTMKLSTQLKYQDALILSVEEGILEKEACEKLGLSQGLLSKYKKMEEGKSFIKGLEEAERKRKLRTHEEKVEAL